jgi:hypothetical protein
MPVKDSGSLGSLRDLDSKLSAAIRQTEQGLEQKIDEIVRPLLDEIRRMLDLVNRFEISEEAVLAFLQTIQDLLGGKPLAVQDARRAGMIAAAGTAWENELGPLLTSTDVRELLGQVSRQRVDELLRSHRLIGLQDSSRRRQFPLFQFTDARPLESLVMAYWTVAEAAASDWTAASWCIAPDEALDGLSPVEWAKAGRDKGHLLAVARQDAARLAR